MAEAGASFGALDGTVTIIASQPDDPVARAADELAWAEDAVERMRRKVERAEADVVAAKQALGDAQDVVKERKRELAEAKKAGD